MSETIASIEIPNTDLVRHATELVRGATTEVSTGDTLFHHSRRVFLWGVAQAPGTWS